MLSRILSTQSVAGRTQDMTELLIKELSELFDTNTVDDLGSLYFTKKLGEGKKLMISCAVDTSGLIATYTDGTKINVSSIGGFNVANLAFSKVKFEKAEGILIPLGGFDWNTPITDYAVEAGNEDAVKDVVLGDVGFFDTEYTVNPDGKVYGFCAGLKTCVYATATLAKKLMSGGGAILKDENVGEICFAFISHENLGNRGSSCVSCAYNPDMIINIAPIDMTEKNVGSLDFDDGFAVKMLDRAFVADEETALLAEKLLDTLGQKHKRRVSNNAYSAISRLGLCEKGAKAVEICLPVKFMSTRGECAKAPF
ncbi:MAG: hypothetical protein E7600_07895 [Ruminococcaceae bacterium]|nr:hypothetical protein [Oscillospiraceae bacterium]